MKKISSTAVKVTKEFFSTEVNHRFGPGRSFELVLPAGRSVLTHFRGLPLLVFVRP
jgi:hypothetical protein